jgi:hypothetical protein
MDAAAPIFDPIRHRRGGRPRKPEQERHGRYVSFWVTEEQRARGEAKAAEAGLSLSEYGRAVFSGDALTIEVAPMPPPELVRELRMIGRNLWQAIEDARRNHFAEAERRALERVAAVISTELRVLLHGPEC